METIRIYWNLRELTKTDRDQQELNVTDLN